MNRRKLFQSIVVGAAVFSVAPQKALSILSVASNPVEKIKEFSFHSISLVKPTIDVRVNGVPQVEGEDYVVMKHSIGFLHGDPEEMLGDVDIDPVRYGGVIKQYIHGTEISISFMPVISIIKEDHKSE